MLRPSSNLPDNGGQQFPGGPGRTSNNAGVDGGKQFPASQVQAPSRMGGNLAVDGGQQFPVSQVQAPGKMEANLGGPQFPATQVQAPGRMGGNLAVDGGQQYPVSQAPGRTSNNVSQGVEQFPVSQSQARIGSNLAVDGGQVSQASGRINNNMGVDGGQQFPVAQVNAPGRISNNVGVQGSQQLPVNRVGMPIDGSQHFPVSQASTLSNNSAVERGQQLLQNQAGRLGDGGQQNRVDNSSTLCNSQVLPQNQGGAPGRPGSNFPYVGGHQISANQARVPGSQQFPDNNLPINGSQQFSVSQGRVDNLSHVGGQQFPPAAPNRIASNFVTSQGVGGVQQFVPTNQEVNKNAGYAATAYSNLSQQFPTNNRNVAVNRLNQEQNPGAYQQQQWYGAPQMPPQVTQPPKTNVHANRYPTYQQPTQYTPPPQPYNQSYHPSGVVQTGFNKLWGADNFDLLQCPNILPADKVEIPRVSLGNDNSDAANCHPDIFRCTVTKIPESSSLLQKSRLPLGVLIHPFRDLNHLPVIQCNTIVRCRACRTYINPFVYFVDHKRWKCNLCYRINELPEEFQYDPVTKTYGDPSRRPEVKTSTIEYIAPAEYMLRPPQPAVYLFLLDVSRPAVESGYLHTFCSVLSAELSNLPGDARTHIGFIVYDSKLHFYSLADGLSQPHEMTVLDVDDVFLPCPDNLLVNLQDRADLVQDLLAQLPTRHNNSYETRSALGAALQAAHKMMAGTGGRVTVFQSCLPSAGPGSLTAREDPSQRAGSDVQHLNPANDFYKRLALECSGQQIAVDLFLLNSQYVDVATVSGVSRFSGGCLYHFPLFKASRQLQNEQFERSLRRYLTRKIGFEAVMRIRCTRGLAIHTFHGNFFVRSTDLLSLPNINPDAGFGMQVSIEENLSDVQTVCFQAALLYTSSKGERRIRVHTMCLPVVNNVTDVINSADQQCIIGLLAKMAVDRSMQSSLSDAREAFLNAAVDVLSGYKQSQNVGPGVGGLIAPRCLRLLPLYISALLKHTAFRTGISTRLDDRVKAMCDMKTKPLSYLIQQIYPDLYPVHKLAEQRTVLNDEEEPVPMPPHLQLTSRSIDSDGAYLLDVGDHMILVVCPAVSVEFLNQALGVPDYNSISEQMYELPALGNEHNRRLHAFVNYLNDEKPTNATLQVMRDNSPNRVAYLERFVEDRMETALSYHEFLQHLKAQIK